jgi:hypothetical protein
MEAIEIAEIRTFGWPIGTVLPQVEYRPILTAGGIRSEVSILGGGSYDYWTAHRTEAFYLLQSFYKDKRRPNPPIVFFNTRIVQNTELLLISVATTHSS